MKLCMNVVRIYPLLLQTVPSSILLQPCSQLFYSCVVFSSQTTEHTTEGLQPLTVPLCYCGPAALQFTQGQAHTHPIGLLLFALSLCVHVSCFPFKSTPQC